MISFRTLVSFGALKTLLLLFMLLNFYLNFFNWYHCNDVMMSTMASQITSFTRRRSKRKHQSSAALAFVGGIHQWPVNSLHKGLVMWKMFQFDDVTIIALSMYLPQLTHWGGDNLAAISQTTLSNAFSWMKILEFRLKFNLSLFLRVQLTISKHWFR